MNAEKLNQSLSEIIYCADEKVLARGRDYYASGQIKGVILAPDGIFNAEVNGSEGELYHVFITIENDAVVDFGCDCPYDWGDVCKHIVAVCLAIQNGNYKKTRKSSAKNDLNTRALLNNVTSEQLKEFVIAHAERDLQFKNELQLAFGKPDIGQIMAEIKERVRDVMRGRTQYGSIESGDCRAICAAFDKILEQAQARLAQGHAGVAFSIAMHILLKSAHVAAITDSPGTAEDICHAALEVIEQCCARATDEADKKLIFDTCVKEAKNKAFEEGWSGWYYDVVRSAARFVTKKNAAKLSGALNDFSRRQTRESAGETLARLEITRYLDGEEAYEAAIQANLHVPEVRRLAMRHAIEKKDYTCAIALCEEFIAQDENRQYHWLRDWYEVLFGIHGMAGDTQAQIALARELLLERQEGPWYPVLKDLLQSQKLWAQEYPSLLAQCAAKLPAWLYMRILHEEKEARLLLDAVRMQPDSVFEYGAFLAKQYPAEVQALLLSQIKRQVQGMEGRSGYKKFCANLKLLAEAGGKEQALAMITEYRAKYPRRTALLEELAKVEGKLGKSG